MEIEFDEEKRRTILAERGIDIADASAVFANDYHEIEDDRKDTVRSVIAFGVS